MIILNFIYKATLILGIVMYSQILRYLVNNLPTALIQLGTFSTLFKRGHGMLKITIW